MSILKSNSTPGARWQTKLVGDLSISGKMSRRLKVINKKHSGRNNQGVITTRHQGGRQKRFLRIIDWKRDKRDMKAEVISVEYDPNRTANIALVRYLDGELRYIIAPEGLAIGDEVMSGENATYDLGNALPISRIPVGTVIHNIELKIGRGAQLARSAGVGLVIQGREEDFVLVKLASGEVRRIPAACYATIGQVSNPAWKNVTIGKAGRSRRMGVRPTVRGTAQHPGSHPHGGGEGRSGIGMKHPKTPWGKHALGKRTASKHKYSKNLIVKSRHIK